MKNFYSRPNALRFLDVKEATLQHAILRGWIVPIRLGPRATLQTEFFLRSDLTAFREKYRRGYYDPSEIQKRRGRAPGMRVSKR